MAKKYGTLDKQSWKDDLRRGFEECMRVLRPGGVLTFKWCTTEIPAAHLWEAIGKKPLYGSTTGKSGNTLWAVFVKGMRT